MRASNQIMIAMLTYKNNKTSNLVSGGLWLVTLKYLCGFCVVGLLKDYYSGDNDMDSPPIGD